MGPPARDAADQALRANPEFADLQFVAGYVSWILDWDWPAAERRLRQAIALDPGAVNAHRTLGHLLSQMGRAGEAQAAMTRALELDPLDLLSHALSSQVAFQGRDGTAAIRHARQAIVLDPTFWIGHMMLGQALAYDGQTDLALEALADARSSGSWRRDPGSATCRPMRSRSCTPGLVTWRPPSPGSTRRTRTGTRT